jgi:LPXTG-motif cell wall-anchored protein
LTLTFNTGTGNTTFKVTATGLEGAPADVSGALINDKGAAKAYVLVPQGWILVNGTAVVSGSDNIKKFNVTHTCPASGSSPSPSRTRSPSPSPSKSATTSPSGSPTGSPSTSPSTGGSATSTTPGTTPTPAAGSSPLPRTGENVALVVYFGLALLATGGALLLVWRRRRVGFTAD